MHKSKVLKLSNQQMSLNLKQRFHTMRLYAILFTVCLFSCDTPQQLLNKADTYIGGSSVPSNTEVINGLKEALSQGTTKGTEMVSKEDGYFKNQAIKVLFPPELHTAEQKMRDFGLAALADNIILSFNRAAESAAKEAKPIFINAIRFMTIDDAMNILLGEENAATNYLRRTTSDQLYEKFKPVIDDKLNKTGATKYWSEGVAKYNQIPFISTKLPADVSDYVARKAMDGIFLMIEKEESRIRQDPLTRAKEILKKVFGYADSKKD